MAVLVEGISVIIRMDRLTPFGSWDAFKNIVPNETLCADTELVRVGFMSPADVRDFIDELRSYGLRFSETGPAEDIAVCDQQQGFTTECDWAEFGTIHIDGDPKQPAGVARRVGSKISTAATPIGWSWKNSLTREFSFVPNEEVHPGGRPIRIKGRSTGEMESGTHGWGVQVQGVEQERPTTRRSLWDKLRRLH